MSTLVKSLVYNAVEVVTGGRGVPRTIQGESIRFPARFSRYYESDYEPETFRFLRERLGEGNVVLDVGAHIGLFSVVAGRLVGASGAVVAFEPTPNTCEVLRRTVHLNALDERVEVRGEAVARASGTATFYDTGDPGSNANSLVASTDRHRCQHRVPTTSLDDFVTSRALRVDLVKVDAEGTELDVLRGGTTLLREQRPAIALALHPSALRAAGDSLEAIWTLLRELEYRVSLEGTRLDQDAFCSKEDLFDVHCVPSSV